ncbi:ATP-dependent RNA helicase [Hamiltosporidium magnivora]|uniref:ATP-dependent RNA helicase n=1 Tax=Hamiltosporidium magnivora TaxID=148818 RepID=A0A4Q9LIF4_9MICR|nr:ATP-dependent RNA helicase [Hamiltosporidium magnivora]
MDNKKAPTVKIIVIDEADAVLDGIGSHAYRILKIKELEADLHETACLHGYIEMAAKEKVVDDFRTAKARVLISTDIFSRGMDIPQVNLIINFDLPIVKGIPKVENYIHRVGRSGRFGRPGVRVDFFRDSNDLNAL